MKVPFWLVRVLLAGLVIGVFRAIGGLTAATTLKSRGLVSTERALTIFLVFIVLLFLICALQIFREK